MNLTDWIPLTTPPVRVGFYSLNWETLGLQGMSNDYWDGEQWWCGSADQTAEDVDSMLPLDPDLLSLLSWRGATTPQT